MWLIRLALRRPIAMAVLAVAILLGSGLSLIRSKIDILPDLNAPVIYVAQPYGGMSPQQIEGFVTYYYEYHFLYIDGIQTVEAKSIQGASLLRLTFHPGTNMSESLAETISYVNRARAFMPPGTVSPFVVRYDAGTLPVGYLVFSSPTKTLGEISDAALNRVRPVFGTLPGVSSPPPFGGNQRTIVLNVDPARLHGYGLSAEEVVQALATGNSIQPAGVADIGSTQTLVTTDSTVGPIHTLLDIPIRNGGNGGSVYMRDVATVADAADVPAGYALIDGKRTVYIPVTKRAAASTISVVNEVRKNLPKFQALLPDDIKVSYQLDQSKYVTDALWSVVREGLFGAGLVGLVILLFLRSWRSAVIVVSVIPLALLSAVVALWVSGQTINIMTLGGLALAIGILVDEGVVLLEHIDFVKKGGKPLGRAILEASGEVATPRLLAMMCIVAVFLPAFFMSGAAQALFLPLSLAVAFSMAASYLLFTIFVPILSNWLGEAGAGTKADWFERVRERFLGWQKRLDRGRTPLLLAYAGVVAAVAVGAAFVLRTEIFPSSASSEIRLRMDAPEGTRFAVTEQEAQQVLKIVDQEAGADNVDISLTYVGTQPSSYPVNLVFLWTAGSHEAIMNLSLKPGSRVKLQPLIARLRKVLPEKFPGTTFSFEPGDLVSQILSYGSPTAADVAVLGAQYPDVAAFAQKLKARLAQQPELADVELGQSLRYPNIDVRIDRVAAGDLGVTADKVARAVTTGTASSRFITPNYWRDARSGISYQVQVQVPQPKMTSAADIGNLPITGTDGSNLVLSQVAQLRRQTAPGELDRQNGQWMVSVTANLAKADVGRAARAIDRAIKQAGTPPKGVTVQVRGQVSVMRDIFFNLGIGLGAAIVVMLLLLTANFQSVRLALIALSAAPAGLMGALAMLLVTNTSLNLESFMGMIMVVGVALANAILLVTFAERNRRGGKPALEAAYQAANDRLRPVLMTSLAMIAGMVPMALAIGRGSQETAPLGRAVIGGLLFATAATLLVLPIVFGLVQRHAPVTSVSLDPDDRPSAPLVEQPA